MGNYIALNSTFNPFTYDELVKPLKEMAAVHMGMENALSDLETQASQWEILANNAQDAETYQQYKNYQNSVLNARDKLATEGLYSPSINRELMNLRSRYASEIFPIEKAYKRRTELADEQRKLRLTNPDLIIDKDPSLLSLKEIMADPNPTNKTISRKTIQDTTDNAVKFLRNEIKEIQAMDLQGDEYSKVLFERTGFTPEEVDAFMNDLANADNKVIQSLFNSIFNSTGVQNWNNDAAAKEVANTIIPRLWGLVGVENAQRYGDAAALAFLENRFRNSGKNSQTPISTPEPLFPTITIGVEGEVSDETKKLAGIKYGVNAEGNITISNNNLDSLRAEYQNINTQISNLADATTLKNLENLKKQKDNLERQLAIIDKYKKSNYIPQGFSEYKSLIENPSTTEEDINDFFKTKDYNRQELEEYYPISKMSTSDIQAVRNKLNTFTPNNRDYYKYEDLINKKRDIEEAIKEEEVFLESIENKYSHLSSSKGQGAIIGATLQQMQEKSLNQIIPFNFDETNYKKVRAGIKNVLLSVDKNSMDNSDIGLTLIKDNGKTKHLNYDDASEVLNSDFTVRVKKGQTPKLQIVSGDGSIYDINMDNINVLNSDMQIVNDYLKDFSKKAIENKTTTISDDELSNIEKNGIENTVLSENTIITPLNNGYYGIILKNESSGEFIKVLIKNNQIVAVNSLSAELNGGSNRDAYIQNMAVQGLMNIQSLVAQKPN